MKIILSPAKKMIYDEACSITMTVPQFLDRTVQLYQCLNDLSVEQLKKVWNCSDKLVEENLQRLRSMDLQHNLTPALLAYEGIAYQYMAPRVFTSEQLAYVTEHLRILSGFYGVLKPTDGVTPYRLEMGAKLHTEAGKDMYQFWDNQLAESLCQETDLILNLASKEYSKAVLPYLSPDTRLLTCMFVQRKGGKLVEQSTACKMARGDMVRYLAERQIEDPEAVKQYDRMYYRYASEESGENTYVFIKEEP